jgi:WD40 repeat protein
MVESVAFSPDGHTLASGSNDRTVRLWDVTDPANPRPLGNPLAGHTAGVNSVAFSPDGRVVATGSGDSTVRLWDVADRAAPRPLGDPLTGHTDTVWSVAFSPDGRTLASGSHDHTVRLWDANRLFELRQKLVRIACEQAGGLDRKTWEQNVRSVHFLDPCKGVTRLAGSR